MLQFLHSLKCQNRGMGRPFDLSKSQTHHFIANSWAQFVFVVRCCLDVRRICNNFSGICLIRRGTAKLSWELVDVDVGVTMSGLVRRSSKIGGGIPSAGCLHDGTSAAVHDSKIKH